MTPQTSAVDHEALVALAADVNARWEQARLLYTELTYERAVLVAAALRSAPADTGQAALSYRTGIGRAAITRAGSDENPPGAGLTHGNRRRAFYRRKYGITDVVDPVDWDADGGLPAAFGPEGDAGE